ncbi:MAG: fibronectin type III domain-containing protein [Chitinispirillia bacterium]|jgi:hypothetical protein
MRIALLLLLILSVLCSKITDSNDSILVKPSICFLKNSEPVTPEFVNKIIITVTFGNNILKDTFNFDSHRGTLKSLIPKNTPFSLELEALDINSKLIYYSGKLDYSGYSKDETVIIQANQVTPELPENLTIHFLSDSVRILKWQDNSSNEEGFIIQKSVRDTTRFTIIDTVDTNFFIDTSSIENLFLYHYRVMAFNSVGQSPSISIPFDPNETVSTPNMPTSRSTIFYVNVAYAFQTDSAKCGNGHPAEYQFDWGNNALSDWLLKPFSSYAWNKDGNYGVKCRIRCSKHKDVVSKWSEAFNIIVISR